MKILNSSFSFFLLSLICNEWCLFGACGHCIVYYTNTLTVVELIDWNQFIKKVSLRRNILERVLDIKYHCTKAVWNYEYLKNKFQLS